MSETKSVIMDSEIEATIKRYAKEVCDEKGEKKTKAV